jgi:FkbM family methyltransferase
VGRRERELDALATLVAAGDHAVDVGANVGIYTKALSGLVGAGGRVHSFEPVADNYAILRAVVRVGHLANVEVFRLALGARPATREIVVPDGAGFGGYYRAHLADDGEPGRRELVDVQTLDALSEAGALGRVDLVKCDVEGAELDVLTGGTALFAAQRPACLVEVSAGTADGVFAFFDDLGYRRLVFDGTLRPADGHDPRRVAKFVFVHPAPDPRPGR